MATAKKKIKELGLFGPEDLNRGIYYPYDQIIYKLNEVIKVVNSMSPTKSKRVKKK